LTGAPIASTQETPTDIIVSTGSIVAASDPPVAAEPDRITFLKELAALHNELFTHSTGTTIKSTQDTYPTDTIMPASSIVATSDPPAAVEPDRTTFLKELDALQNKLTLMRSTRTFLQHTTDATYIPTTVTMNNDQEHTVSISERNSNETHHNEKHHNDHSYAHHPHDNHASNNRVNEISDHADRTTNDCRWNEHQHDDKNKTHATEHAAHEKKPVTAMVASSRCPRCGTADNTH